MLWLREMFGGGGVRTSKMSRQPYRCERRLWGVWVCVFVCLCVCIGERERETARFFSAVFARE